jgi:hypothetical protein
MAVALDDGVHFLEEPASTDSTHPNLPPAAPRHGMGRKVVVFGLVAVVSCAALISAVSHGGPAKAAPGQAVGVVISTLDSAKEALITETHGKSWNAPDKDDICSNYFYILGMLSLENWGRTPTPGVTDIRTWYETATAQDKYGLGDKIRQTEGMGPKCRLAPALISASA